MLNPEVVRESLDVFRAAVERQPAEAVHLDACLIALFDLLAGDPTRAALAVWATEHPDAWACLAAVASFGDPLRPLDRIPAPVQRFLIAYDCARAALEAK